MEKIPYEKLEELIIDRIEILGMKACCSRSSFIFQLKSVYGDTFDTSQAEEIYQRAYQEFINKDN